MSTEEIPCDTGVDNPGYDEAGEQIEMRNLNPCDSARSGSSRNTVISRHSTHGKTSFGGDASETTSLLSRTESIDAALDRIIRKFPNANTTNSPFTPRADEYDRVMVRLNTNKGKYKLLFKGDGKINDKLPKTIIKSLGQPAEEIIETNGEEIARRNKKIAELREQLATTSNENQRESQPNYC